MFAAIIARKCLSSPNGYAKAEILLDAITPYDQADKTGVWESGQVTIAHALTWNTSISKYEATPYQCPDTKLVIASWLRLDNRAELFRLLRLKEDISFTDPMLVIAAYQALGHDCANCLEGDFSFVIYDPIKHECFAARDSLGAKPFFYYYDSEVFVFSTTAAIFPRLNTISVSPSEEWMALYLLNLSSDYEKTAYNDVWKLPPAHYMVVTDSDEPDPQSYFKFKDNAPPIYQRDTKWVDVYREKFCQAVDARLSSTYLIAAESSGGLDSSTIVAHAAENVWHGKDDFHCFGSYHMEREAHYLLETGGSYGLSNNHIVTEAIFGTPSKIVSRAIKIIGYPVEQGIVKSHFKFYEYCAHFDIRTLLSGLGGDEFVTNQASILQLELLKQGEYLALYKELPNGLFGALRRIVSLIRAQYYPVHESLQLKKKFLSMLQDAVVKKELIDKYDIHNRRIQRANKSLSGTVNGIIFDKSFKAGMTARMEGASLMAGSYKVEYRWPLLDRCLIQQYLNTPSIEKRHKEMGRYLHRRANLNRIPSKVLWKTSKNLGKPIYFGQGFRTLSKEMIANLHPKLCNIIDKELLYEQQLSLEQMHDNDLKNLWPDFLNLMGNTGKITELDIWLKTL